MVSPGAHLVLGSLFVALIASCGRGSDDRAVAAPAFEAVAEGLVVPWALAFAPDGRIFLTERPGRIRIIQDGTLLVEPWARIEVQAVGEAGLMGIALSPDFAATPAVYVAGTFRLPGGMLVNRVLRLTDRDGSGTSPVVVVDDIPAAAFHAGTALSFGPDGMLYVATGDAREPRSSQDPASRAGKILRYTPDGEVPRDNPRPGSPIYASGLRNPQGIAWEPKTGELFAIDHGPSGFPSERFRRNEDELDVIRANGNYGWPSVAGRSRDPRFAAPLTVWNPGIAPAGLAFYTGPHHTWAGDAFVGGLRGQQLRRVELRREGNREVRWRVASEQIVAQGQLGRIRAVVMGPDGSLYVTTSNRDGRGTPRIEDDRLLRVIPPP